MTHASVLKRYAQLVYALAVSQTDCRADAEAVFRAVFERYAQTLPFLWRKSRAVEWFSKTTLSTARQMRYAGLLRGTAGKKKAAPSSRPSQALIKRTRAAMPPRHSIRGAQCGALAARFLSWVRLYTRAIGRTAAAITAAALIFLVTSDVVALPPSANGCTVQITEARVCNDLLYLTVEEDYSGLSALVSGADSAASSSDLLRGYDHTLTEYFGTITDHWGHVLSFSNDEMYYDEWADGEESYSTDDYHTIKHFRVYVPGLADYSRDTARNWRCAVNVTPKVPQAGGGEPSAVMTLRADSALSLPDVPTKIYDLDYSYTVGDVEFAFRKLYIGETEHHIAIELIPHGSLEGIDPQALEPDIAVMTTNAAAEPIDYEFTDERQECCITHDSRYYFFLTDKDDMYDDMDDHMLYIAEHGGFEAEQLSYIAHIDGRSIDRAVYSPLYDLGAYYYTTEYDKNVSLLIPTQTVAVGEKYDTQTDDDGTSCDLYRLSQTFQAGDFSFRAYCMDSDQAIYFDDMQMDGNRGDVGYGDYEANIVKLHNIVFVGQKDGADIGWYELLNVITRQTDRRYGYCLEDEDYPEEIPDTLTLAYVEYSVYSEQKPHIITGYRCYNPDYYTPGGMSLRQISKNEQTKRESAEFSQHNTITVVR